MYTLKETTTYIQETFPENEITEERVEECYIEITNPANRIKGNDEPWVACEEEHELNSVLTAMDKILVNMDEDKVKDRIEYVCQVFQSKEISHKPRIPFYVLVLDWEMA
ncbi:MAG: Unknown protein [uncultured Sulfurovum sp.]|uniref:Uncharacterized protein n=1 Tax=uncultured Sulfurovum sp. TaxID=269237 RepID=A0A6S6SXL6_9BACT|nr:MAG: Unknown protein [uncultured Sulfurovum sp.]